MSVSSWPTVYKHSHYKHSGCLLRSKSDVTEAESNYEGLSVFFRAWQSFTKWDQAIRYSIRAIRGPRKNTEPDYRNLQSFKAPLESQEHGTSLFPSLVEHIPRIFNQRYVPARWSLSNTVKCFQFTIKAKEWKFRVVQKSCKQRHVIKWKQMITTNIPHRTLAEFAIDVYLISGGR